MKMTSSLISATSIVLDKKVVVRFYCSHYTESRSEFRDHMEVQTCSYHHARDFQNAATPVYSSSRVYEIPGSITYVAVNIDIKYLFQFHPQFPSDDLRQVLQYFVLFPQHLFEADNLGPFHDYERAVVTRDNGQQSILRIVSYI